MSSPCFAGKYYSAGVGEKAMIPKARRAASPSMGSQEEEDRVGAGIHRRESAAFRIVPAAGQQSVSVAAMTALMVCMRFSASSKTMDWGPSNTSSVTSMAVRP